MISGSTLGVTGPERMASGWGPNVCSYAGQPYVSGYRGGPPVNLAGNWPDFLVGVIMAFSIMSALRCRERTGRGQYIEVSMAEVVSSMMPEAFLEQTLNGRQVERMGNHDPHMAPHNVYPCQGFDQWAAIAVGSDEEWRAFCQATGHPEWMSDPRFETLEGRKLNEAELDRLVSDWTRQRAPQEVTDILQGAGIAAGPVKSIFDLMEDPHLNERGFIVEMDHLEVGRRRVAGLPARFSAMPQLAYSPAPLLGQHNSRIFGELLGIERAHFERLVKEKAIY
jgi:crotonobetainyl-CoA:carnitine CoA-transferase CaiB-like acyl-CoA transferase